MIDGLHHLPLSKGDGAVSVAGAPSHKLPIAPHAKPFNQVIKPMEPDQMCQSDMEFGLEVEYPLVMPRAIICIADVDGLTDPRK